MKNKIFIICLTFNILFLILPAYASYGDISGFENKKETAAVIDKLQVFGILDQDGYDADSYISRGEYAKILCRLAGLNQNDKPGFDTVFSDVTETTANAGEIIYAYKIGLMNGYEDGLFYPEDKLGGMQAVKTIVNCLGYEAKANQSGGYPLGYLSVCSELKLKIPSNVYGYINFGELADLIYSALDTDMVKQVSFGEKDVGFEIKKSDTLLKENLKIIKDDGQVTSNYLSGIKGYGKCAKGSVGIDGDDYLCDIIDVSFLLGYKVNFYYKEAGSDNKIIYIEIKDNYNESVTVKAQDIVSYGDGDFVYNESDDKRKTIHIGSDVNILLNGIFVEKFDKGIMTPENGSIVFLDADCDGQYGKKDVIYVKSYETMVAASASTEYGEIYDKYVYGNKLELSDNIDDGTCTIKDIDGTVLGLREIRENDVLAIKKGLNNEYIDITIVDTTVSGVVTALDDNRMATINGKEYEILKKYYNTEVKLKVGMNVKVYLDLEGRIAAYEKNNGDTDIYAYIIKCERDSNKLTNILQCKLFTQNNEFQYITFAKTVTVNSKSMYGDVIPDALKDSNGNFLPQIVQCRLNANNEVSRILTAGGGDDGLFALNDGTVRVYRSNMRIFGGKFGVSESTMIFDIPNDLENEENYAVKKISSISSSYGYKVIGYTTQQDSYTAQACLIRNDNTNVIIMPRDHMLVEKLSAICDENGDATYKLTGIMWYQGRAEKILKSKSLSDDIDLEPGDVIRFATENSGKIAKISLVFDYSNRENDSAVSAANGSFLSASRTYCGYAFDIDGSFITAMGNKTDASNKSSMEVFNFDTYKAYMFEKAGYTPIIRAASIRDIVTYSDSMDSASRIVITSDYDENHMFIIYK